MGLGGLLLVGAMARFEVQQAAACDRDMAEMTAFNWKPPIQSAVGAAAVTDAGRPVPLWEPKETRPQDDVAAVEGRVLGEMDFVDRVVRVAPAGDECNCHGWVFTGGRYWLAPQDVAHILVDNGYQVVPEPRVGDLAIYTNAGTIGHTAVVRTAGGGGPVLVEGKWGWMGVFLHPPEGSCYGRQVTFYRGLRAGHLLVGLGGHPANSPTSVPAGVVR